MRQFLMAATVVALATAHLASAATDDEVLARKEALQVAGAFANDGFKMRDGCWQGPLAPKKPVLLQVNLYAGNEYWFVVGATAAAKKLSVTIYDEAGKPVSSEPYEEGSTAAAGFAPEASGPYYVRVEALDGAASSFCLVYSYK